MNVRKTGRGAVFVSARQDAKGQSRSSANGRQENANEQQERCVRQPNYPTQAKTRLEWATGLQREFIFANGKRIARRDISGGAWYFYFTDHLGSSSVVTNSAGAIQNESDYYPYGGERVYTLNLASQNYKFTGKERDTESGLDNFGARYNASSLGRFMSVDPIWVKADRIVDPQRLNLYAYGRNNPLKFTDPTGMDLVMGQCTGGTVTTCFNRLLQGLKKEDRAHVHLVTGDGKNGFKKGVYGVTVDKEYSSGSKNFGTLQAIANDHSAVARMNVAGPNETIQGNVGVADAKGNVSLQSVKQAYGMNFSVGQGWQGQTFDQDWGGPYHDGSTYSTTGMTEVYVANDAGVQMMIETMHHELRHVLLGDFGRSAAKGGHDAPGVTDQTKEAQKEADDNIKQK